MDRAINRIDAACARIERAANRPRTASLMSGNPKLEETVRGALRSLDGIIAELER